ncbi:MAG: peptidase domain-containing protein [bacterium]|nr:MAG: peptidase domain-containing protein [bacterium]
MSVILLIMITNTSHFISANSTKLDKPQTVIQQDVTANNSNNTNNGEITELQLGKAIERDLAGGKVHSYNLTLEAKQYLQATVEQKGIDVVVAIYSPDGKKVYEMDSPNGETGPEPVYLITETSGQYRLEVNSLEAQAKPGKYQVKLQETRIANEKDKPRVVAYKAYSEAILLEAEGKPESVDQAIAKYEEAISLFQSADEPIGEANSLNNLAMLYHTKGDYAKAEPFYKRTLIMRIKS